MIKGILLVVVLLGMLVVYNSNEFQAFFLSDRFYENIYSTPFDVTQKGATASLPIEYKHKTVYKLLVTVPEESAFDSLIQEEGRLRYRFLSGKTVLHEGATLRPERRYRVDRKGSSSLVLLLFSLPISGVTDDLFLELKVITPFVFLEEYSDSMVFSISPAYHK